MPRSELRDELERVCIVDVEGDNVDDGGGNVVVVVGGYGSNCCFDSVADFIVGLGNLFGTSTRQNKWNASITCQVQLTRRTSITRSEGIITATDSKIMVGDLFQHVRKTIWRV